MRAEIIEFNVVESRRSGKTIEWPKKIIVEDGGVEYVAMYGKTERGFKCPRCGKPWLWKIETSGDGLHVCTSCGQEVNITYKLDDENFVGFAIRDLLADFYGGINKEFYKQGDVKKCKCCKETLHISEFDKFHLAKDGYLKYCKTCHKKYREEYRRASKYAKGVGDGVYIPENKSGIPGVSRIKHHRSKPYKAEISKYNARENKAEKGKKQFLGSFATIVEAGRAYFDACRKVRKVELWEHWTPQKYRAGEAMKMLDLDRAENLIPEDTYQRAYERIAPMIQEGKKVEGEDNKHKTIDGLVVPW